MGPAEWAGLAVMGGGIESLTAVQDIVKKMINAISAVVYMERSKIASLVTA